MTSFRPQGDKAWNYVRENDKVAPFIKWVPRGPNLYECWVTEGWPAKVQSNQPDYSYATKDLFEPHPTIPRAWKYIARMDDTIVLVNGEKFNPLALEGSIRSNNNVKEAIVYGSGRPYVGVLVVPAAKWAAKPETAIMDAIWPLVEANNHSVDAFARISRSMVRLLPWDCKYPQTDKGSIIRQACYKDFRELIDESYDSENVEGANLKQLDLSGLRSFLRDVLANTLSAKDAPEDDVDFFTMGLDSLQAIQMRSEIAKNIDVGNHKLGQNVVFENPSIERLAQYLLNLRLGKDLNTIASVEQEMAQLIEKYGDFRAHQDCFDVVSWTCLLVGSLILTKLRLSPEPRVRLVLTSLQNLRCIHRSLRFIVLYEPRMILRPVLESKIP